MGQEFNFSITQFNLAFEFINQAYAETREYAESVCDYIESFFSHYPYIWKKMLLTGTFTILPDLRVLILRTLDLVLFKNA